MALFLVTRPVTLNLVNSIKCVGDSRSYLSFTLSLLCAPAATHFMFIHFITLLIILYYGQVYQEYTTVYRWHTACWFLRSMASNGLTMPSDLFREKIGRIQLTGREIKGSGKLYYGKPCLVYMQCSCANANECRMPTCNYSANLQYCYSYSLYCMTVCRVCVLWLCYCVLL